MIWQDFIKLFLEQNTLQYVLLHFRYDRSTKLKETRATLVQYTPVTEAFDRDVGIIGMLIGDMLWPISG
jgi:hypothetical protein